MKAISFSDIKRVSWLQGYSEVQMLDISMDEKVYKVLDEIGIDLEYGIEYIPAQHRNMKGEILVGYMAVGEVSINRKHLLSKYADLTDVLICAAHTDPSLAYELGELSGKQRSYNHLHSLEEERENFDKALIEPTWGSIEKQLKDLSDLCLHIRGPQYNASGSLKTMEEYKEFNEQRKQQGK